MGGGTFPTAPARRPVGSLIPPHRPIPASMKAGMGQPPPRFPGPGLPWPGPGLPWPGPQPPPMPGPQPPVAPQPQPPVAPHLPFPQPGLYPLPWERELPGPEPLPVFEPAPRVPSPREGVMDDLLRQLQELQQQPGPAPAPGLPEQVPGARKYAAPFSWEKPKMF
jgi:hypothetical protein